MNHRASAPLVESMSKQKYNVKKCPNCKQYYVGYPAISRRDNKTEICSNCGQSEAIQDYINYKRKAND